MKTAENTKQENTHPRSGWSYEETDTLFNEARAAGRDGRPIKSVFDKVAMLTGRKPNSIRNYYYLKLKENDDLGKTSFVPFQEEEVHELIKTMLREQAEGKSVRSIAMAMGEGDKKNMLRYQNKYRSMLRNNPDYVKGVMEEMRAAGENYIDPFAEKRRRAGRKNRDMGEMAMELIASLSKLGKDGEAIVSSLYEIFCRASGNTAESDAETPRELSRLRSENARLERELEQLHQSKKQLAEELAKQAALGSELECRLSTLESLNRGFVTLAGMEKISGLSDYVTAITRCIGPQDSSAH